MRREIRRLSPEVRIQIEDLREMLRQEVLKREVLEGDKAEAAKKKVHKASSKLLRAKKGRDDSVASEEIATYAEEKEGHVTQGEEPVEVS